MNRADPLPTGADSVDAALRSLLAEVLGLPAKRVAAFEVDTALFGALPEFDSMAVATLLTGLEERLHVLIEDDDVEAEDFMTFGRLLAFAERKVASR
jgi:acyl carrier protein